MENNNYVSVGNIIEQERLKRQAQIAKGVSSDVYDHIEKAHQDDLSKGVEMTDNLSCFANDVDNLNKAETEFLLSKLQRQIVADPESSLLKSFKSIAIDHLNDIEKGVYTDNAQNRKLGRVGQEYGGKKADDGSEKSVKQSKDWLRKHKATGERIKNKNRNFRDKYTVTPDGKVVRREMSGKKDKVSENKTQQAKSDTKLKSAKQVYDEDFNDDLKYFLDNFTPFGSPKEAGGVEIGSVNDKGEIWVPSYNKSEDGAYEGKWMSKEVIEDRVNRKRIYNNDSKLTAEQKKAWPIGTKYKDERGREFTIVKHDSSRGRIKLLHVTDDGKKKAVFFSGYDLKHGLHPNFTTKFPEIDKKLREVYDKAHAKD